MLSLWFGEEKILSDYKYLHVHGHPWSFGPRDDQVFFSEPCRISRNDLMKISPLKGSSLRHVFKNMDVYSVLSLFTQSAQSVLSDFF